MTRAAFILALMLVAGSLAACGSIGKRRPTVSASSPQSQIRAAYVEFFSSKTSVAGKVRLLQNGPRFSPAVRLFASSPMAKKTRATVSSVTLRGPNKAKVVYQVHIGFGLSLGEQTGYAVHQNGTWKVTDASLCKLLTAGGASPPGCTKS